MPPQRPPLTFARFVGVPENRSALVAVQQIAEAFGRRRPSPTSNPLYLHGPSGTGKTHLVSALVDDVTRRCPRCVVRHIAAAAFKEREARETTDDEADLLIIEDLQHLPVQAVESTVRILERGLVQHQQIIVTATVGPQHLSPGGQWVSARLASRLAAGLVVRLELPRAPSRLLLLSDKAQRRQLAVGREILTWLAEHISGGGRQLEGALAQLETLSRLQRQPLRIDDVAAHFRVQTEASRLTVERIAERVGGYFRVEPRHLQSRRRQRNILVPRQVSMYLTRQLTKLSLAQIGVFFGGRDHSTVLHACRKVQHALENDAALSGAVRQLHAELA